MWWVYQFQDRKISMAKKAKTWWHHHYPESNRAWVFQHTWQKQSEDIQKGSFSHHDSSTLWKEPAKATEQWQMGYSHLLYFHKDLDHRFTTSRCLENSTLHSECEKQAYAINLPAKACRGLSRTSSMPCRRLSWTSSMPYRGLSWTSSMPSQ